MGNENGSHTGPTFTVPKEKIGFLEKIRRHVAEAHDIAKLAQEIKTLLPQPASFNDLNAKLLDIHKRVTCAHNPSHALAFIRDMLHVTKNWGVEEDGAVFVEAGCFKGGSTAKFSLIADLLKRPLYVFDSFEGLPDNSEDHTLSVMGHSIKGWFSKGNFSGRLDEVKYNIGQYGKLSVCKFFKGWFSDTMPGFKSPVAAAFLDVDLASSTRTCLQYLYPLLMPGGIICSQDGDFPLVIELFKDKSFWDDEMKNYPKPIIQGLGRKITRIIKPR